MTRLAHLLSEERVVLAGVLEEVGVVAVPEQAGPGGHERQLDAHALVRLVPIVEWITSG